MERGGSEERHGKMRGEDEDEDMRDERWRDKGQGMKKMKG